MPVAVNAESHLASSAIWERLTRSADDNAEIRQLVVTVFAEELIRHLDVFEADAVEQAFARYDELTARLAEAPSPSDQADDPDQRP